MRSLNALFGRSPFEPLVEHARKVHQCVTMIRPVAEAILAGDMPRLAELQHTMSQTEYEADLLKDRIRQNLPRRYFLPVSREDVGSFLREMDRIADGAEDFAVLSTFRPLGLPPELHGDFLAVVDKVVEVSGALLELAEHLAELQKEAFSGPRAEGVLKKIQDISHKEWESDKLSRRIARHMYGMADVNPVTLLLVDKLCRALAKIADHAENVGKSLRLMILRR